MATASTTSTTTTTTVKEIEAKCGYQIGSQDSDMCGTRNGQDGGVKDERKGEEKTQQMLTG